MWYVVCCVQTSVGDTFEIVVGGVLWFYARGCIIYIVFVASGFASWD